MPSSPIRKKQSNAGKRKAISLDIKTEVLTEAGYRCAVPTCRTILALDIHHMAHVAEGGGDVAANLLPLCLNCHGLYHKGIISRESIYVWKSVLISLTRAFDIFALDQLLLLAKPESNDLGVSGDGVLSFARLIGAGLATFDVRLQNGPIWLYSVKLTTTGSQLVSAWTSGDRRAVRRAMGEPL